MSLHAEIWQQRRGLWLTPLLICLVSVAAFLFYRVNFAGESAGLERRLAEKEQQLARQLEERGKVLGLLEQAEVNRRRIAELYEERFATRRQRLTQITEEVKALARRAGLDPRSITYPEDAIQEFGLVERSFDFSVEGSYPELRAFLSNLELSTAFLTLEEVRVSGNRGGSGSLSLSLRLSTLFADEGALVAQEPAS